MEELLMSGKLPQHNSLNSKKRPMGACMFFNSLHCFFEKLIVKDAKKILSIFEGI